MSNLKLVLKDIKIPVGIKRPDQLLSIKSIAVAASSIAGLPIVRHAINEAKRIEEEKYRQALE